MRELLWVLISSFLMGLLTAKTKQEENFYKKRETQYIINKYKITAKIIESLFIIILCGIIPLALYQSNGYAVIAIFLISLYTLSLMACISITLCILCKINKYWSTDEFYIALAASANISLRRLKQIQFFLLGMSYSGLLYSSIRLTINGFLG